MKQLLKILDDDNYVSMYRLCEDGKIIQNVF